MESVCLPLQVGVASLQWWAWSVGVVSGCGFSLHRMDDQLLEVVGLYSSLHVGKIQVSLGEPLRMGQAKEVKVSRPGTPLAGPGTLYSLSD